MPTPKFIFIISLLTLLAGCGSSPTQPPAQPSLPQPSEKEAPTIESLLAQASQSFDINEQSKLLLQASGLMQQQQKFDQSDSALKMINFDLLDIEMKEQYILLSLENAWQAENTNRMKEILDLLKEGYFQKTSPDIQKTAFTLIANAYEKTEQPFKAAIERINASALFTSESYWENLNKIWTLLVSTPTSEVATYTDKYSSVEIQGWLQLTLAIQQNQFSLDQQVLALNQWLKDWSSHPAALRLPDELQLLLELPSRRPSKIALALPLSGKLSAAGTAVLDGFLSAFYADKFHTSHNTNIQIFDTNSLAPPELIQQFNAYIPDLIIGPLQKKTLQALTKSESPLASPILALNYLDSTENIPSNLFQFGLAPEDEANQVINRLWNNGTRKIAIIAPDSDWGARLIQYIQTQWEGHNGIVVDNMRYSNSTPLNKSIAQLLSIKDSRSRARALRQRLPIKIDFEPRRRQDIETVLLIASPEKARQIKPLLSFYYAGDIPIYALSKVYSGEPHPEKDNDLNGITFTGTPWTLSNTNQLKNQLQTKRPDLSKRYSNLMALGVDAYRLAPRLELLTKIKNSHVQGENGVLRLDQQKIIHRESDWAKFVSGKPLIID